MELEVNPKAKFENKFKIAFNNKIFKVFSLNFNAEGKRHGRGLARNDFYFDIRNDYKSKHAREYGQDMTRRKTSL